MRKVIIRLMNVMFIGVLILGLMQQNFIMQSVSALDVPVGNWQDDGNFSTTWYGDESASAFTIASAQDLAGLATLVNGGNSFAGKTFTLTADIDLAAHEWTPIGNATRKFSGSFNGQNYVISNLTINRPSSDWLGLFGNTGSTAALSNLGLTNVNIVGSWMVGGLVGDNFGTITNSYSMGKVYGYANVGGLVGRSFGAISNCYAAGDVTSTWSSGGGLVGQNLEDISHSYSNGSVNGDFALGGLVGENYGATIKNSYSTSDVAGTVNAEYLGGLVGLHSGTIENAYATGNISGRSSVGGLVGDNYNGVIINAYASGAVSGTLHTGGLVGSGVNSTITDSYWDTETSGQSQSAGGIGKSTLLMKQQANYTNWDFAEEGVWAIKSGSQISYPYFQSNTQSPAPGLEILSYSATINLYKDGNPWALDSADIRLSTSSSTLADGVTGTLLNGVYTFVDLDIDSTYYVWEYSVAGSIYTGQSITNSSNAVTLNYITLQYDGHESTSGSMATRIALEGATFVLDKNTFEKSGYVFGGWNTAVDGSGTHYADQEAYTMPAMGQTLYAQWTVMMPDTAERKSLALTFLVAGLVLMGISRSTSKKKVKKTN